MTLPRGQFDLGRMPRFGLPPFAGRLPKTLPTSLKVKVGTSAAEDYLRALHALPRVVQASDFHCVTGWSCRKLEWSGWRFADLWHDVICAQSTSARDMTHVIFVGADGYAALMRVEDLLASDVMLADQLNGAPLDMANGAALRLVAPAHYGYKSVKHLASIRLTDTPSTFREPRMKFLTHPRARVAQEERGQGAPAWLLRYLYRPSIRPNIWLFKRGLQNT